MRDLEKYKAARDAWKANNPEKLKEYSRRRYHEKLKHNPEVMAKRAAYHAEWQKENKDKWNAYVREYRRKKRAERSENG